MRKDDYTMPEGGQEGGSVSDDAGSTHSEPYIPPSRSDSDMLGNESLTEDMGGSSTTPFPWEVDDGDGDG